MSLEKPGLEVAHGEEQLSEFESLATRLRNRRNALTVDDLAELLSLSAKHLYKMAKGRRIPSLRLGGAVRFDPFAVAQWLEAKSIG